MKCRFETIEVRGIAAAVPSRVLNLWDLAAEYGAVEVQRIIASTPPPWVVHLRFGNLRRSEFHIRLARAWPQVEALLKTHKLVNVYLDRVEGVH